MTEKHIGLGSELGRRTGAMMVAEGVGIASSLGSLLLTKAIVGKERINNAKEWLAMKVVLPVLERTDSAATRYQNRQGGKGSRAVTALTDPKGIYHAKPAELLDKASIASGATPAKSVKNEGRDFKKETTSLEDKARKYADTLLDMAIMLPVGVTSRLLAQQKMDTKFGAPEVPYKRMFFKGPLAIEDTYIAARVPDFLATQVSLVAMNTVARAPAQALVNGLEHVLTSVGVPQTSANSMAKYCVYVQGSNAIGNAANVGHVTAVNRGVMMPGLNPFSIAPR